MATQTPDPMFLTSCDKCRSQVAGLQQSSSANSIHRVLTLREVAAILGVHLNTVNAYRTNYGLPWVQLSPRRVGVVALELQRWLDRRTRQTAPRS